MEQASKLSMQRRNNTLFLILCFKEQCGSMDETIRVMETGGASWSVEVNMAASLLTRLLREHCRISRVHFKNQCQSRASFKKILGPYSKDIQSVPVPSPSAKTHL